MVRVCISPDINSVMQISYRKTLHAVLMVGVPARRIGWMRRYGERLGLPVRGDDVH